MSLFPSKYIPVADSVLARAAHLPPMMGNPVTVSQLWERARNEHLVESFQQLVMALDLLFALGAIEMVDGRLRKTVPLP